MQVVVILSLLVMLGSGVVSLHSDVFRTLQAKIHTDNALHGLYPVIEHSINNIAASVASNSNMRLTDEGISADCTLAFTELLKAANHSEEWAALMLDSQGRMPPGLLKGRTTWLGAFEECQSATANSSVINFNGLYCTMGVNTVTSHKNAGVSGMVGQLDVGVCVPDICTDIDIITAVNIAFSTSGQKLAANIALCQRKMKISDDDGALVTLVILSIISFLVLQATLYDVFHIQRNYLTNAQSSSKPEITTSGYSRIGTEADKAPIDNDVEVSNPSENTTNASTSQPGGNIQILAKFEGERKSLSELSSISKLLLSFSLYTNSIKVFSTNKSAGTVACLNGIRFLSMAWVILGHTYAFCINIIDNIADFQDIIKPWSIQPIMNGTFSVDTFFLISGILVAYLTLKEMNNMRNNQSWTKSILFWVQFYFHRFWRLTPVYMLLLAVDATLWKYFLTGPLWPRQYWESACVGHNGTWWTNLLYINNFVKLDHQCMGWSWYLANDMQMYVVSPIFLYALHRYPKVGQSLLAIAVAVCVCVTGAVSKGYNLPMEDSLRFQDLPKNLETFNKLYVKPYIRMSPYIIGMYLGYLLQVYHTKLPKLHKVLTIFLWAVSTILIIVVVYGTWYGYNGYDISQAEAVAYNSFARTLWSLGIAWVIYSCMSGTAGYINDFLSWSVWSPLARLTYCAYLVHPMIIYAYYFSHQNLIHLNTVTMVPIYLSLLCLAYLVAYFSSMLLEAPMIGIEKVLLHRG